MNSYVPRTVTELRDGSPGLGPPKSLSAYEDRKAYVLLGAPGAGKTREFEEAAGRETNDEPVTARDFMRLSIDRWQGKTIFIDALDEMRGQTASDPRRPLDRIREKLEQLGVPRFRLSCRDADWLGQSDTAALDRLLMGDDELCVLRLNPLTRANIEDLTTDLKPAGLVDKAQRQGLLGLLDNPLTLRLFAKAWEDGKWPESIRDAYSWGCRQLAQELNREHQVSDPTHSIDDLLNESGLLSAIFLLSGLDGIGIHGSFDEDDIVSLIGLSGIGLANARAALTTRLFEVNAQIARPMHRQTAEFLAADYLAKRIEEGLSLNRILNLLTETGDRIATPLRGLSAWLSVHSPRLRDRLVRLDPIGTVSYGDVRSFSRCEKQKLVACLERSASKDPWTFAEAALNARWGGLVTHDMAEDVKECLIEAQSRGSKKWLSYALIDAMRHGNALPEVLPTVQRVLEGSEYQLELKKRAFEVFKASMPASETCLALKDLLDQAVDDPTLRGRHWLVENLLMELYPCHIPASEVAKYLLLDQPDDDLSYFWGIQVLDRTESADVPSLLDGLCALAGPDADTEAKAFHRSERFLKVFAPLLTKLLKSKDSIPCDKLYSWLDTATASDGPSDDLRAVLAAWLEENPHVYEEMQQKIAAESSNPKWDMYRMFGGFRPRSRENAERYGQVRDHSASRELAGIDFRENRDKALYEAVNSFKGELLENRGSPKLLSALVDVYDSRTSQFRGETPNERLLNGLGGDEALANAATYALKETPRRVDLPSAEQVIGLAATDQLFAITDPYLTGLSMAVTSKNDLPTWFDEGETRRALAFRLCALSTSSGGESPLWYAHLVERRPNLVADMFEEVAVRTFRSKVVDFPRMYDLSRDDHRDVARLIVAPLLRKFPVRGVRSEKLYVLINLLQIAIRVESKDELLKIVEYKLARKSLAANQRVYWNCFGMGLDGAAFVERLYRLFAGEGHQRLLPHLVDFLFRFKTSASHRLHNLMDICAMKALVQILGPGFKPNWFRDDSSSPRHEVHGSIIVNSLINALAQNPSPEARKALVELADESSLRDLRERFRFEESNHRHKFPESGFEYLEPEELLRVLRIS